MALLYRFILAWMRKLRFLAMKGFVESSMPGKPVLVCTRFVGTNPLNQVVQVLMLLLAGTKLLRFPRPRAAVGHACINPRVKEDKFIAVDQYRLNNVCVAAFYDPARMF
jgi:hypothetical protein